MGKGPLQFLKTKVAMALIGTVLIGGTSAVLAARTVNEPSVIQTSNSVTTNSNSTTSSQLRRLPPLRLRPPPPAHLPRWVYPPSRLVSRPFRPRRHQLLDRQLLFRHGNKCGV